MKVNFKELLGEKYTDEIASVLEPLESSLINNSGGQFIPKARFDQVNESKKLAELELEKLKNANLSDEEKRARDLEVMLNENKAIKSELNAAKIGKLFADSGIKNYDSIVKNITSEDFEKSEALAIGLIDTFKNNLGERDKEIERLKLTGTPKPDGAGTPDPIKTDYTYTELAEIKSKDEAKYKQIMAIRKK